MANRRDVLGNDVALPVTDGELERIISKLRFHGTAAELELSRRLDYIRRTDGPDPELEVIWDDDSLVLLGTLRDAGSIDLDIPRTPVIQPAPDETASEHTLLTAGVCIRGDADTEYLRLHYVPRHEITMDEPPLRDQVTRYTVITASLNELATSEGATPSFNRALTAHSATPPTIPVWEHPKYERANGRLSD